MNRVSDSRRCQTNDYNIVATIYLALHPNCEACRYLPSAHVHHKAGKEGIWLVVVEQFMAVCFKCHRWIHDNPAEAMRRRWMIRRATRDKTMATPKQDYNPFDMIGDRLRDVRCEMLRVTVSRAFADKIVRTVIQNGCAVKWADNHTMHITDHNGVWPAMRIRDDLDGDVFIIEQAKGSK